MTAERARTQELLARLENGDDAARSELIPLLYEQLRSVARALMSRQPAAHTLQPTALVHEAFLRLGPGATSASPTAEFMALAATAMRSVLIDHARALRTVKRDLVRRHDVELDELPLRLDGGHSLIEMAEAIGELEQTDVLLARIAELRVFGGMEHREIAQALGCSERTSERRWRLARVLLERWIEHN